MSRRDIHENSYNNFANHFVCSMDEVRHGKLQNSSKNLRIASWNVEGLSQSKESELVSAMMDHHIDILCIQETRRKISCLQELPNDFLLILSGSDGENDIFSGVGIIVAPHCRRSLITYRQQNERMCMIKLKVKGGKMILFSTYAPPQTIKHSVNERQQFFNELAEF